MLNAPYSDKTLMRNTLAYALAAATGHYAPRTRFCEVWLGEQYQGVYVLTDNSFRWTSHISQAPAVPAAGGGSAEAAVEAAAGAERMLAPFVAFPCGVLRGALHNL